MSETTLEPTPIKQPFEHFWGFIFQPRHAFQALTSTGKPSWWLPMLLLSAAVVLQTVAAGILKTRAAALGELVLPPDWEWWTSVMQENYLQGIQTTQGPAYVFVLPAVTGLLGLWLGWPIFSSILHLSSTLLGGRGSQSSTLNMVAWANLPKAIRGLLRAVTMLLTGHLIGSPGLSGFISSAGGSSIFLANLLKHTDLFLVWQIGLLGIGLSQLNGLSRPKTWLAVLLVSLAALLILAALSSLFANLSGSVISRPFYF